ncbi:unnamed protein product [Urochloa humidicola]
MVLEFSVRTTCGVYDHVAECRLAATPEVPKFRLLMMLGRDAVAEWQFCKGIKAWQGRHEIDFSKFFVLNAKVLKKMEFGTLNNCNDKWVARLQLDNRASQGAQFKF